MIEVEKIDEGVVIDHIPAGRGILLLSLLEPGFSFEGPLALLMNARSSKMGRKDIVKIARKSITEREAALISLLAPNSTINHIEGGKVVRKVKAVMPDRLEVGECPNPKCISKVEGKVCFLKESPAEYACFYCERSFLAEELVPLP